MRAVDFVQSYINAWNLRDPKYVAEHLADEGVYCDIPDHARHNRAELVDNLGEFFAEYRHRYELVGEVTAGPNTIAFQYRIQGLTNVDSTVGAPQLGAEFITLHGETATTIVDYYDAKYVYPDAVPHEHGATMQLPKYAKSGLSNEQVAKYKCQLERIMLGDRAFQRTDLSLPRLAQHMGCSVNHLSQVINAGFGMSFFDYLNQHRIEFAKQLLLNNSGSDASVLSIAFAAGFNSSSAFYSAFRKIVGQSPAQYRRSGMLN